MKYIKTLLIIGLCLFSNKLISQKLIFGEINPDNFTDIYMQFYVADNKGKPITSYQESDFVVTENGETVDTDSLTLECTKSTSSLNIILTFDVSTSMRTEVSGQTKLEWAKGSAHAFVNQLELDDFSQIAITTFGQSAKLACGFTNDREVIAKAIDDIASELTSTDFNSAFLDDNVGIIDLIENTANINRKVLFLSDGLNANTLQYSKIRSALRSRNVQLYAVTFLEGVDNTMRSLALATNGYYEFVEDATELRDLYISFANSIERAAYGYCSLGWKTKLYCGNSPKTSEIKIKYKPFNVSKNAYYTAPEWSVFDDGINEESYFFDDPEPEESVIKTITIKPQPYDYTIENFQIKDTKYFEILDYGFGDDNDPCPFTIKAYSEHTIKVKFTQHTEKLARQTQLMIAGYPCTVFIDLFAGLCDLSIIKPMADDVLLTCDSVEIRWLGVHPDTRTALVYRNINQVDWLTITSSASGLKHKWLPPEEDGKYIIKATAYIYNEQQDVIEAISDTFELRTPLLSQNIDTLFYDTLSLDKNKEKVFEEIISNNSKFPAIIKDVYIENKDGNDFTFQSIEKTELSTEEKTDITIEFNPAGLGKREATLFIEYDCGQVIEIPIVGVTVCQPIETIDSVDIGAAFIDKGKETTIHQAFYNPMPVPIVFSANLSGADYDDFFMINIDVGETYVLLPEEYFDIEIRFLPRKYGTKTAKINIFVESCDDAQIDITGHAEYKLLTINDLDFGRKRFQSTYDTLTLAVHNNNRLAVTIKSMKFVDINTDFHILDKPQIPHAISGHDTLFMQAIYRPKDIEKSYDSLIIITTSGDSCMSHLRGEAYRPELYVETICPPETEPGDSALAQIIIINNSDTERLRIDTSYVLENDEFFEIDTMPLPKFRILAIGDTIISFLQYKPLVNANHQATVSFWADNYNADFDTTSKENTYDFFCDILKFQYSDIEFSTSMLCDSETSSFEVSNLSSSVNLNLLLEQAEITGDDASAFDLLSDQTNILSGGATADIEIKFTAEHKGEHQAFLTIPTSSSDDIELILSAKGIGYEPKLEHSIIKYYPQDIKQQKFKVSIPDNVQTFIEELRFEISYDRNMLFIEDKDINLLISENIDDGEYLIWKNYTHDPIYGKIRGEATGWLKANKEYDLLSFNFFGLLPNSKTSIISYSLYYPCSDIEENIESTVEVEDNCLGENRFVEFSENIFYCNQPYPNPVASNLLLNFGLAFQSNIKISLFDMLGNEVAILSEESLEQGNYTKNYLIPKTMGQGEYILKFETPSFQTTYNIIILK